MYVRRKVGLVIVGLLFGCGQTSPAASGGATEPSTGPVDLSFMLGCWDGANEHYLLAESYRHEGDRIIGESSLTQTETHSRMYEHTTIALAHPITLTPTINGEISVAYRLIRHTPNEAQFENLAHDFPTRISYTRAGPNLMARIEGHQPEVDAMEWTLEPVDCEAMAGFLAMVRDEVQERSGDAAQPDEQ